MTLQEEHLNAIENFSHCKDAEQLDYLDSSYECATITKAYMKGFEQWKNLNWSFFKDGYISYKNGEWIRKNLDELIELYLTEKQSQ